jgi:hypothetical protein
MYLTFKEFGGFCRDGMKDPPSSFAVWAHRWDATEKVGGRHLFISKNPLTHHGGGRL